MTVHRADHNYHKGKWMTSEGMNSVGSAALGMGEN